MGECRVITENILIDTKDIEFAHDVCNIIDSQYLRSKSVANIIGPRIAAKILDEQQIDIESGLHNLVEVLEDIDISDIYINNNYIDVRLYIEGEQLSVPAEIVNNLPPKAFMFIKIDSDLHHGTLSGFMPTDMINKENVSEGLYIIQESDLLTFDDIENLISEDITNSNTLDDLQIYKYLDNKDENKYEFYSQLIKSKDSRLKFKKYINAQSILNFISRKYDFSEDFVNTVTLENNADILNEPEENINQDQIFNDLLDYNNSETEENIIDTTLSLLEEPETNTNYSNNNSVEYTTNTFTNIEPNIIEEDKNEENEVADESIEELFSEERLNDEQEGLEPQKKNTNPFRAIIATILALLVAGIAYLGITKFNNSSTDNNITNTNNSGREISSDINKTINDNLTQSNDAMPLESIETNSSKESKEVGNPVNIPAIEKNLDTSVIVSNLKIDWEVPSGYASNASAKRYLIKLGKVIQHNLKAELLLLNKLPITNNVAVEIKFNSLHGQFEVVGITNSSGDTSVDNIIMGTIKKALKIKLSSNVSTFTKLQGNPILVIHF